MLPWLYHIWSHLMYAALTLLIREKLQCLNIFWDRGNTKLSKVKMIPATINQAGIFRPYYLQIHAYSHVVCYLFFFIQVISVDTKLQYLINMMIWCVDCSFHIPLFLYLMQPYCVKNTNGFAP